MRTSNRRPPIARARAALIWERLASVLWPALGFITLFALLAVFGLWERLGDPWRALALLGALGASGLYAWRAAQGFRWPGETDALRRIEDDSELNGRPFEALRDAPAASGRAQDALWTAHQARVKREVDRAKVRRPHAAWAIADPHGLRGVMAIAAIVGVLLAGPVAGDRVGEAFALRYLSPITGEASVQAWIDPPDYTGRPPIFLDAREAGAPIAAPIGSVFVARAAGGGRAPKLQVTGAGRERVAFESAGPGAYEARAALTEDVRIDVRGGARGAWRVRIVPDRAPAVAFAESPEPNERQELTFAVTLSDDYGVRETALRLTRRGENADVVVEIDLASPPDAQDARFSEVLDLTSHPWAGDEVNAVLVARDELGQTGVSESVVFELPEKLFIEPLAKALVEQRKAVATLEDAYARAEAPEGPRFAEDAPDAPELALNLDNSRKQAAPPAVHEVKDAVDLMRFKPELFDQDPTVHLGLAWLGRRLGLARDESELEDLPDVMWDLALRAEGGEVASAERALREAERRLARALALGADEAEIQALMQAYQQAVDRYMDALRAEALAQGRVADESLAGEMMSTDTLQEMLQALRDLAETGSNDDARRLLAQLTEMIRNMQMNLAQGGGGGGQGQPSDPLSEEMREALEELGDLISRQRELADQTVNPDQGQAAEGENSSAGQEQSQGAGQDQAQQGSSGQEGGEQRGAGGGFNPYNEPFGVDDLYGGYGGGELTSEERRGLGDDQGELADQAGDVGGAFEEGEDGGALSDAEQAMRDAEGALRRGDRYGAQQAQADALQALRDAAQALSQRLLEENRRRAGLDENGQAAGERDPFGRPTGTSGFARGDGVEVPDQMERRRAREILDELRRRAGEANRPEEELDYIERLLDRF